MKDFSSLYIHIPFCISKCAYCDFFSVTEKITDEYVDALCNEIKFRLKNNSEKISTVYIGGGTPSLLNLYQLQKITETIYKNLKSQIKEFTIEVNPDDVKKELVINLYDFGVNRISCGLQSFNDDALSFCHRRANRAQNLSALSVIKNFWKGEISLDLISALPNETEKSFLEGLQICEESGANHISLYSLCIEEETPLFEMIKTFEYDYDRADKMWILGRDFLRDHKFMQYEVSNFCKNEKISLHNFSYWNRESYIGCGSGATGTFYNDDGTAFRWNNTHDINLYINFWKNFSEDSLLKFSDSTIPNQIETVNISEGIFEFFMMGLRKRSGVSKKYFEENFHIPFPADIEHKFMEWQKKELAKIEGEGDDKNFSLNEDGILFLNKFLSELKI